MQLTTSVAVILCALTSAGAKLADYETIVGPIIKVQPACNTTTPPPELVAADRKFHVNSSSYICFTQGQEVSSASREFEPAPSAHFILPLPAGTVLQLCGANWICYDETLRPCAVYFPDDKTGNYPESARLKARTFIA